MPKIIINNPANPTNAPFVNGLSNITYNAPNPIGNAIHSKLIVANVLFVMYYLI